MQRIWISIGSNIEAEANVRGAVRALRRVFGEAALSPVYRTAAVGFAGPPFLNLVAGFETDLPAEEVMLALSQIEERFGRTRGDRRFDSRTLDLDLLTYGNETLTVNGKHLPRAEILEYGFVLKPLADVAPLERHPEDGRRYAEHWAAFRGDRNGMTRVDCDLG